MNAFIIIISMLLQIVFDIYISITAIVAICM